MVRHELTNRRSRLTTILAVTIGISVLMIVGGAAVYFVLVRPATQLARSIGAEFREAFGFTPHIVVGGVTVLEQNTPVLELATVQRDATDVYEWSNTWLGSTKKIILRGNFRAKAGFDLRDDIGDEIAEKPARITANLPMPELLSFELVGYSIVADEDGFWNKVTADERQKVFAALQQRAREKVTRSDILPTAKSLLEKQLNDLAARHDAKLDVRYHEKKRSIADSTPQGDPATVTSPAISVPRK